jgi:beta-1,4-mannosyl-glycoprotein beta-1,4-N-acetylglucosaminyltransferase
MTKVYDCCIFYEELDMLETRMHILEDVVDYFVICEAAETHSGKPKPFNLADNAKRFERWQDKIVYVMVTSLSRPAGVFRTVTERADCPE